jgi:hypothetical protein
MSANAEVLQRSSLMESSSQEKAFSETDFSPQTNVWSPEGFAREQIRGLVRRVFFRSGAQPVKQIVISAAEAHSDVGWICDQVGQALALETDSDIAIVSRDLRSAELAAVREPRYKGCASIKSWATLAASNLWRVPEFGLREPGEESGTGRYWLSRLAELRNEFEYLVIHGPAAGVSSEAALLGQLADGIILVLDAHSTRRATACKIKETLEGAQSRILGTVLSERTFPVPERIYRRL